MLRLSSYQSIIISIIFAGCLASGTGFAQADEESDIQFAPDGDPATPEDESEMMYKDEDEKPSTPDSKPTVEPVAPPVVPAPTDSATTPLDQTSSLDLSSGRRDVLFGTYRVRFGFARPEFDKLEFYDNLYGRESWYPTLAADWFFWDWYATLGLSFRGGFYTAQGKAAKKIDKPLSDVSDSDVVKDSNSTTNLTLLPFQVCFTAEITPLRRKWLVVDGYVGYEYLYWQEVRSSGASSSSAVIVAEEAAEDDSLTNRGSQKGTIVGVSANILLNGLDEASANSMRGSMGLGNIYLSPFMEIARTFSARPDFSRKTMGLGFTFESIK